MTVEGLPLTWDLIEAYAKELKRGSLPPTDILHINNETQAESANRWTQEHGTE